MQYSAMWSITSFYGSVCVTVPAWTCASPAFQIPHWNCATNDPKQVSLIHLADFSFKLSVTIIPNKWVSCVCWLLFETLSPPFQTSESHTFGWLFQTFCHHHPKQVSLIHLADFSFKLSLSSTYLSVLPWWLRLQTCLLITPQTNEKSCTCERGPSGICRVSCSVPQLTTQGVTLYMQLYMDKYIPQSDRTCMQDCFLTPPHGQLCAIFRGFISISGGWTLLCEEPIIADDIPA